MEESDYIHDDMTEDEAEEASLMALTIGSIAPSRFNISKVDRIHSVQCLRQPIGSGGFILDSADN